MLIFCTRHLYKLIDKKKKFFTNVQKTKNKKK